MKNGGKNNKKRVSSMGDKQDWSWAGLEIKNKNYFAKQFFVSNVRFR